MNNQTGQLILVDQTGSIDCVIASWEDRERETQRPVQCPKCSLPQTSLPAKSSLPQTSLPAKSSLPQTSLPAKSSLPQTSLPAKSSLPQTSLPAKSSLPQTSLPAKSSLPQTSLPAKSSLPQTSLPAKSSLPQTSLPAKSSLPQTSLPAKSLPVQPALPAKSSLPQTSLPANSSLPQTSLPAKSLPVQPTLPAKCWCGHLQPSQLGCLVRIDRFNVAIERFVLSTFPCVEEIGNDLFIQKLHLRFYLQFSMKDVTFLSRKEPSHTLPIYGNKTREGHCILKSDKLSRKREMSSCEDDGRLTKRRVIDGQKDYDSAGPLHAEKRKVAMESQMSDGRVIPTDQETQTCTSQLFIALQKDSLQVQSRISNSARLRFFISGCFVGDPLLHSPNQPDSSDIQPGTTSNDAGQCQLPPDGETPPPVRHVALSFQNTTVRWYHLVRPGQVYRLVWPGTEVFGGPTRPTILQRAITKTGARQCLPVNSNVVIYEVNADQAANNTCLNKVMHCFLFFLFTFLLVFGGFGYFALPLFEPPPTAQYIIVLYCIY